MGKQADKEDRELAEKIGGKLRPLRESKGLPLASVASACGCHAETVRRIEAGENLPSARMVVKLAEFYEITPNDLLL